MRRWIIAWFIIGIVKITNAQEFGGNRFSMRWKQIKTDTARIIYPEGVEAAAKRVATIIHNVAADSTHILGSKMQPINIVLQNQTMIANGYVGLGPYRSEFYLTPPADNFDQGTLPWVDQLALHEYRHVQQYNNFNNGISRVMHYLFGQDGYDLAVNAAIPNWFFEGDAVYNETVLSAQGRGRMPSFLKAYPALWNGSKKYSWMKLRNGSYKDYVPDHYDLGYLLVNYGYTTYGSDFWQHVYKDATEYNGLLYPMQHAIEKYAGVRYPQFIDLAFDDYKKKYQKEWQQVGQPNITNPVPASSRTMTHYYYPYQIGNDSLLYLRSAYNQRAGFYIKDAQGEHLLRIKDISIDNQYSYKNGKIIYTAFESHPRWQWISYSVIKILDIKTGHQQKISSKSRYFSPDISDDEKTIVANKVLPDGSSALVLIDVASGKEIHQLQRNDITYYSTPKFTDDQKIITVLRKANGIAQLALIDVYADTVDTLMPASYQVTGQLFVNKDSVFFTGSSVLRDDIFLFNKTNQTLYKLPSPDITNYFVNAANHKITWSSFTADGYRLRQMDMHDAVWQPLPTDYFLNYTPGIVNQSAAVNILQNLPERNFASQDYHKLTHPFNFHSWRPNYDDPEYSFTVYGNNVLNTTQTQLYYVYNENQRTHAVGGAILYGGLFPYINIGSQYTFDRKIMTSNTLKEWNEWDSYLGLSIPLSWVSGRTYKYFSVGSNYNYRYDFNKGINKDHFKDVHFGYLSHSIGWAQQVQKTLQDMYPKWGYDFTMQFRHAISQYNGWQGVGKADFFLPGLMPVHHLVLTGAYQQAGGKNALFGNRIAFARGFNAVDSQKTLSVSANYHLPLWYPDWGFGNILYVKRIRANGFYDNTLLAGSNHYHFTRTLQSAGVEMYLDTKWWNQYALSFGIRGGYLLTKDVTNPQRKFFCELILPVIVPK